MDTPHPDVPESRIAYIRAVPVEALPDEIRERLEGAEQVYGVHTAEGEVLALASNRRMAFALAREHDLAPVSAH